MKIHRIYASEIAALDSDVYTGGGTDDTEALQKALDLAKDGDGVYLIMDGAALISQLRVYSNTTIECLTKDCGFYQIPQSNRAMIRNAVFGEKTITTKNVSLIGGTYHQNGQNQEHDVSGREVSDYVRKDVIHFVCGIEFYGIEQLTVRDVIIRDFRTFAFMCGCFRCVTLQNVWLELPYGTRENQDGFHFWGPGQFLNILNCGGRVGDDIINVGPDEGDLESSITDVLIDGIFMDDGEQAIRLLSRNKGRLDRVTIRNVSGSYGSFGFYICPWFMDENRGNFGSILIENVDLRAIKPAYDYRPQILFNIGGNIESVTVKNIRCHGSVDNRQIFELGLPFSSPKAYPGIDQHGTAQRIRHISIEDVTITETDEDPRDTEYIGVYEKIDNLVLRNIKVFKDQEPNGKLMHISGKGSVGNLIAENIYTKGVKTIFDSDSDILKMKVSDIAKE